MPDGYSFFFSYATANHANAKWVLRGTTGNHLDEFFDALEREVSDVAGPRPAFEIYRDRERIKVGEYWGLDLVAGLQKSRVLLALISPHYLESQNCGRELGFFYRRLRQFAQAAGGGAVPPARILPVFWEDVEVCFRWANSRVKEFLKAINFKQEGLPENYPAVGLSQICKLRPGTDYEKFLRTLATRIVDLVDAPEVLPELQPSGLGDFSDLKSLITELEDEAVDDVILAGPGSANVVYLVGTQAEMDAVGYARADRYGVKREEWRPFMQAPGATVELMTNEGSNQAGLTAAPRHLELPPNVKALIEKARQKNSPVLLVYDPNALEVAQVVKALDGYRDVNYPEICGLVTAGDGAVPEAMLEQVFGTKRLPGYPLHRWDVPRGRDAFVASVAEVLNGMKQQLMAVGDTVTPFASAVVPGIPVPGGR